MSIRTISTWIKLHKILSSVILILVLIGTFFLWPKPPKPIATETVKRSTITQSVSASGTIFSRTSVDLNFITGGKLVYLGAKKGDEVSQYQVIATLDQRTMQKNFENALIDYSKQRLTFDTTKENNNNHTPQDALNDAMKRVLENNQYDLNKAVNSVELSQLAREQSVLTTPLAGIVTRADVQSAGVNIGPTAIFTIADPNDLIFQVEIDESDIGKIQLNQSMKVLLDAFPDMELSMPIEAIDFASHTTTTGGTAYNVQAALPQLGQLYRLGMNGDAEIIVAQKKNAIVIPLGSMIDENHVYVMKGKEFERREIKTGIQSDTETEVKNGLVEGEKVALIPDDVEKQFPKLKTQ